jgi:succinyl-CoA synthetase beta subunit
MKDKGEEDPREEKASAYGLSYISLDGNIGCMVNGAGLAMATMDIIRQFGGEPANFLDVGGGATAEKVAIAFEILLSDTNVKSILINIFGGIMKCDIIAQGIISAANKTGVNIPIVARLEGTNAERGKTLIKDSGMEIISAATLTEAVHKAVELAQKEVRI